MTKLETVQLDVIEYPGATYVDPETAQIIIDQIKELKRKTAIAQEQLLILKHENRGKNC